MNTGEHTTSGEHVHDDQTGHTPDSALTELRTRLKNGLARAGLNKTQLAGRAELLHAAAGSQGWSRSGQFCGTRSAGPGVGWAAGWLVGGASSGPDSYRTSVA